MRQDAGIRPVRAADAEALGVMHHQAWVDTYRHALPGDYWDRWTAAASVLRWRRVLSDDAPQGVQRLLAQDAGEVAGFVVVGPARVVPGRAAAARPTELWSLYVALAHLGSGLGQRLLDAALEPTAPAELWVFEQNARARAFYHRNRFQPDGAAFVDGRFPELTEIRLVR